MGAAIPLLVICWIVFEVGFLAGCWWAGRGRSGVRERHTDYEYGVGRTVGTPPDLTALPPVAPLSSARRNRIWQRIKDRIAVDRLIDSLPRA